LKEEKIVKMLSQPITKRRATAFHLRCTKLYCLAVEFFVVADASSGLVCANLYLLPAVQTIEKNLQTFDASWAHCCAKQT